nr:hypothetical protein [Deltaproteobacteria bacterium]
MSHRPALHVATLSGWYRFERSDSGLKETARALTYWSLSCLAVDPERPQILYAGTDHSGLFYSHDSGAHWQRANPGTPHLNLFSLLALPGSLLVGTRPAAVYRGVPGKDWEELEGVRQCSAGGVFPPNPELAPRIRALSEDPRLPSRLYAGVEVGGLLVSDDGGNSWQAANEGLTDPDIHQICPSGHNPELVITACGEGVFCSNDLARHWKEVTPKGARTYGTSIAESTNGTLYVGISVGRPNTWLGTERANSAILTSRDGGEHWDVAVEGLHG